MPTSRHRRKGRNRPRRREPASWNDPDLAPMLPFLHVQLAVDARERMGDVEGALELMEQHPWGPDGRSYWAPWRVERLLQAGALHDVMPGWAVSRWVTELAFVHLDDAVRRIMRRSFELTQRISGVDLSASPDPVVRREAHTRVIERDWVFRQSFLFEHGGLQHFLRGGFATPLVRRSDSVEEWVGTPIRALRLVASEHHAVTWSDLATAEVVETLNLGAGVLLEPGQCVLGRVVPSTEGALFESSPLRVTADVAEAVAAADGDWGGALVGRSCPTMRPRGCEHALLTDLPVQVWAGLALSRSAPRRTSPDELDEALVQLVVDAARGELDVEDTDVWPCVAATVVDPGVWPAVVDRLDRRDVAGVVALGQRLVGPAAALCWRTARLLKEAG